ncbi:Vegetative incompatibility protein HET-E-1 [Madurella mycetomatis]|uniref:Vegetative incompatibility protein HET-E-1 n=1 Tax=Madurella mycetomatis TaxID=100816 RepID=A0A175W5Q9_9PEZI|nr:Vegetative incompatibility protein HET-E-1 [Madurella mycetomatis]KXX78882.1 Vegetative incompatibility protein HET-E-1 [Madurella mycetomatis]
MRLLNTLTLKFEEFLGEAGEEIPPYAILSHTWGPEEVSYKDYVDNNGSSKLGYEKIVQCCRLAVSEGFDYVWIDTCCIDKSSSAELSEAINSMMRWYRDAAICYAYLSDVDSSEDAVPEDSSFARSRWFTRGWTLQELLAPAEVVFLGSDWKEIGTKKSLRNVVSRITGIDVRALDNGSWLDYSVAQKMSWAARRQTTRPEDEAYCLMGLFDVNMPMLYGEGRKAFYRLQQEILKQSHDQSLFAWSYPEDEHSHTQVSGLLAPSPEYFRHAACVEVLHYSNKEEHETPFELVHQMARIRMRVAHSVQALCLQRLPGDPVVFNVAEIQQPGNPKNLAENLELQQGDSLEDELGKDVVHDRTEGTEKNVPVVTIVFEDTSADEPANEDAETQIADPGASREVQTTQETTVKEETTEAVDGSQDSGGPQTNCPVEPGKWRWYIYEPVMVVPLRCHIGGHKLGILLSRGTANRADSGVLSRLHNPSLVAINGLQASHFSWITTYAGTTIRCAPPAPHVGRWPEIRIAPLPLAGYALHDHSRPGWVLNEPRSVLLSTRNNDLYPMGDMTEFTPLALFYKGLGSRVGQSVFFVSFPICQALELVCEVGVFKGDVASLELDVYTCNLADVRHAKVLLGNGQAVAIRYREGAGCKYVALSVDDVDANTVPLASRVSNSTEVQTAWLWQRLLPMLRTLKSVAVGAPRVI